MITKKWGIYVNDAGVEYYKAEDVPLAEMLSTIMSINQWQQWRLQKETGIDQAQISRILTGKSSLVTHPKYLKVLELFKWVVK